jgi:hypothetical protein
MAAGQLSLTRRALLAACEAPALAPARGSSLRLPALDAGPMSTDAEDLLEAGSSFPDDPLEDAWDYALARHAMCDAALAAAAHSEDEDLYDRLGERHEDALQSLLRTPAPDVAALALKLDLALDERSLEYFGDLAGMRALKEDARRLSA